MIIYERMVFMREKIIKRLLIEFFFFKKEIQFYEKIFESVRDNSDIYQSCYDLIVKEIRLSWNNLDINWFIASINGENEEEILKQLSFILAKLEGLDIVIDFDVLIKILNKYPDLGILLDKLLVKKDKITDIDIENMCSDEAVQKFLIIYFTLTNKFEINLNTTVDLKLLEDSSKSYLTEISQIPLLSSEEELRIFSKIKILKDKFDNHNLVEREKIEKEYNDYINYVVEHNLAFVAYIAKRFVGFGIPFLDLVQEGNLGLIHAAKKYDYTKGYKFSTYAYFKIRANITRSIENYKRSIRLPIHIVEEKNKIAKMHQLLLTELNREPTNEEIANKLGLNPAKVQRVLQASQNIASLNAPVGEDDTCLEDFIIDEYGISPEDWTFNSQLKDDVKSVLKTLPKRYQEIIKFRFGFFDGIFHTQNETGKRFNLTGASIQMIEKKVIKILRTPATFNLLVDYYDGVVVPINLIKFLDISTSNINILVTEINNMAEFQILFNYYGKKLTSNILNSKLKESEKRLINQALTYLKKYIDERHPDFKIKNAPIIGSRSEKKSAIKEKRPKRSLIYLKDYLEITDAELEYLVKTADKSSFFHLLLVRLFGENYDKEYDNTVILTKEEKRLLNDCLRSCKKRINNHRKKLAQRKKYLKEYLDATDEEINWLYFISSKNTDTHKVLVKMFGEYYKDYLLDFDDLSSREKNLLVQWLKRSKLYIINRRMEGIEILTSKEYDTIPSIFYNPFFKNISLLIPEEYRKYVELFLGFYDEKIHCVEEIAEMFNLTTKEVEDKLTQGIAIFKILVSNYQKSFNKEITFAGDNETLDEEQNEEIYTNSNLFQLFYHPVFRCIIGILPDDIKNIVKLRLGLVDGTIHSFTEIANSYLKDTSDIKILFDKGIKYLLSIISDYEKVYKVPLKNSLILARN